MKCLKCNHELKEGMSFCPSCGSEIPKRQTCPNCGHEINNANSRFCKYCGARLANEIPDTSSFLSWKNTMRGIGAVALILFIDNEC